MKTFKHLSIAAVVLLFAAGCKKDKPIDPNTGVDDRNYFPVEMGQYRVYDVDSIQFYDVTLTSDTFHYQVKEEVSDWVMDEEVSSTERKSWYELKIYRRTDTAQAWTQTGFAMEAVSSKTGDRIQDNLHFVNLSFPVALNRTWKGNAYLTDSLGSPYTPDWDYTYTAVDTSFSHQGVVYDQCAVVTQYDSENAITKDIEREAYARGIGLVYKNQTHVERQNVIVGSWIPEKGRIVTYRLREHN